MKIKNELKRILNTGKIDSKELIKQIKPFVYVSFDIFDTLIKRIVENSTDVFYLMEDIGCAPNGFAKKRIYAEKVAREKAFNDEVTIEEIYSYIDNMNKNELKKLMDNELKIEEAILIENKPLQEVFNFCINSGKRVFLISDIYLPEHFIKTILKKTGYTGYEKLYISSTWKKTKSKGNLFDIVLLENKIESNNIIHIGDSKYSDYSIPKKKGMNALHIPTFYNRLVYSHSNNSLSLKSLKSFLNICVQNDKSKYYHFGYEVFGPYLWGFSKWILKMCKEKELNHVYFFSRDGWIMKKAFDIINTDDNIKSFYLEVSRRSLRVPILWSNCEFKNILNMISPSKLIHIKSIFDGIGLSIKNYTFLLQKYGFDNTSVFNRDEILKNKNFLKMYDELKIDIIENSRKEYELLKEYIIQNHISGDFAIVDIGWSGGMQRYLIQTLREMKIDCNVTGFYTGVANYYNRNKKEVPNLDLNGYLFDFMHEENAEDKRSSFVGLYETLFLEQDGSVKNYYDDKGVIKANRYAYEYIDNGKPSIEYLSVKDIQEGALNFISDVSKNYILDLFEYTADELFESLYKVGTRPNKRDLQMFSDFRFFDEGNTIKLANPKGFIKYFINPVQAKNDFLSSRWKIGFMKKLFKVKLPYQKIYNILKKN